MKRLFFIGILSIIIAACSNDRRLPEKEIPASVQKSLTKYFPEATETKWIMYNFDYQAHFEIHDTEFYALFDENGELYIHRKEISSRYIDDEILKKVNDTYPGYTIDELYEIIDRGKIMYKFEMDKIFSEKQTVFYLDGELFQQ